MRERPVKLTLRRVHVHIRDPSIARFGGSRSLRVDLLLGVSTKYSQDLGCSRMVCRLSTVASPWTPLEKPPFFRRC